MYKTIIFDFFGVFCPDISMVWFKKTPNAEERLADFCAICDKSDRGELTRQAFYEAVGTLANMSASEAKQGITSELHCNETLVALVARLAKQYKLAILSNTGDEWITDIMAKYDLAQYFDDIIISSRVGYTKPQREIFNLALERLGVPMDQALFIDDRPANVEPATGYGLESILFTDTESLVRDLKQKGIDVS